MDLLPPVKYLEASDFTPTGHLMPSLTMTPVFVLFQTSGCNACRSAKPSFQALANEGMVRCMTVQIDGTREGERALPKMIHLIYPDIVGVPSYMLYIHDRRIPYTGPRTLAAMKNWVSSYL